MKEEELDLFEEDEDIEVFDDEVEEHGAMEIDPRQLREMMSSPASDPNVVLDLDDYDMDSFQKGIDDYSYASGAITAILNTGVSEQFALEYLIHKETVAYNLKAADINKSLSVEVAKIRRDQAERQDL